MNPHEEGAAPAAKDSGAEKAATGKVRTSKAELKRRRDATRPTNDEFTNEIEELRTLLADADEKDVKGRHKAARKIHAVRDNNPPDLLPL